MPLNDDPAVAAHAAGDVDALVRLYRERAEACEGSGDLDAACYYLTNAYIWALQSGHPETHALHAWLKAHGREA